MIIVAKRLVPGGHRAITVWPFIIVREEKLKQDLILINHERIHIRQQLELLVIPFYILYAIEFLFHLILVRNRNKAYRKIVFEKEAYANESNLNYLTNRPFWRFFSFFGRKSTQ